MGKKRIIIFFSGFMLLQAFSFSQGIKERFGGYDLLSYKVKFNGVSCGEISWRYVGEEKVFDRSAEVLFLDSDTTILSFLSVQSKERVFLDSQTYLPLKVERDVLYFGKKDLIEEVYDQKEGTVTIKHSRDNSQEVLKQEPPIRHILALLYFFPKDEKFELKVWRNYNLPTRQIKIMFHSKRFVRDENGDKKEALFFIGRGGKKFNLWLDEKDMTPIKLEFIVPLGKISIVKKPFEPAKPE